MPSIMIRVTLPTDMKSTAVARCEELLVHTLVADNEFVESAVILREVGTHPFTREIKADENTRQER
jgi:hypothetical protein